MNFQSGEAKREDRVDGDVKDFVQLDLVRTGVVQSDDDGHECIDHV